MILTAIVSVTNYPLLVRAARKLGARRFYSIHGVSLSVILADNSSDGLD